MAHGNLSATHRQQPVSPAQHTDKWLPYVFGSVCPTAHGCLVPVCGGGLTGLLLVVDIQMLSTKLDQARSIAYGYLPPLLCTALPASPAILPQCSYCVLLVHPEEHKCADRAYLLATDLPSATVGFMQVNHLGPYTLTRLLEKQLVDSKARVVNVVSVTHRITTIKDARALFTDWKGGFYQHNKLANVYTAFELQRRLGARGLQACAADPGAVRTNIYNNSPKLGRGFIKTMIDNCYAPPEDGAQAVIYAATCDWDKDKRDKKDGSPLLPHEDLRYYARGVFTWPQLCNDWALGGKGIKKVKGDLWGFSTVVLSFLDWPLRRLLGDKLMGRTKLCRPGSHAYKEDIAKAVWEVSAEFAGVPVEPQV
eukprot:GHRR01005374.1.p1 GENE.GHRR01005374.1~~GHRR01005374.1.p1  ORF type:complete len:366 (+),score=91.50 GHRR01005374.1:533-1630(+)